MNPFYLQVNRSRQKNNENTQTNGRNTFTFTSIGAFKNKLDYDDN